MANLDVEMEWNDAQMEYVEHKPDSVPLGKDGDESLPDQHLPSNNIHSIDRDSEDKSNALFEFERAV
jgi:hypothetical protein